MSTAMTNERLQKLLALKKREEMKDALNEEMKAQYSGRGVPSQRIEREVQNFIRCAGLTESNLNRLNRRMDKVAQKKDGDNMSTVTGVSAYSLRSTVTGVSKYTESQPGQDAPTTDAIPQGTIAPAKRVALPKDELPKDNTVKEGGLGVVGAKLAPITEDKFTAEEAEEEVEPDFAWAQLDKYAALLHERDACQKKEQITRLQNELKKDLDQQVTDKRIRKQKENEDEQQYFEVQLGEIEKWKEHEKNRIIEVKAKHQKEKEERDQQLTHSTHLKKAQAEKQLTEDRALLDKIAQELDTERRLYDTRRKQHKEAMSSVWKSTQSDVEDKKSKHAQQMEEDTKQMHEYINMLEAKEKKTQKDAKDRLDRHAEFLNNMKAAGLEEEKEREMTDTVRVAQEQKSASLKALQLERQKRDELKAMRLENQSYLFEQMKQKEDVKKREQEEKLMQAQYLACDTAHFHEAEQQKITDKRERNVQHRRELENQIMSNMKPYPGLAVSKRTATETEVKMSQCEVKMNKRLVTEVKTAMAS
eukprot:gnl/MRDRNA2_/MRDRNA2_30337_c0_seq1.p1 gnl/MRDRNA2_/MRDRNA2_30337_c0~~gnl/MRDRNA2_/MRDRNA2_30337_c0_seq1.p1  ORF type:complete len:531 (-),score=174.52 gnl/MRDRNA2_/MRDRNA2_30337_c0_seq1:229-1821(-)